MITLFKWTLCAALQSCHFSLILFLFHIPSWLFHTFPSILKPKPLLSPPPILTLSWWCCLFIENLEAIRREVTSSHYCMHPFFCMCAQLLWFLSITVDELFLFPEKICSSPYVLNSTPLLLNITLANLSSPPSFLVTFFFSPSKQKQTLLTHFPSK